MNIPGLISHNPYLKNSGEVSQDAVRDKLKTANSQTLQKSTDVTKDQILTGENQYLQDFNPDKIITKQERKFFIKMFPESSVQLENHILFTRNGRTQHTEVRKGMIVDGKV
jgi:hypothetical protein